MELTDIPEIDTCGGVCPFCEGVGAPIEHKANDWSVICLGCGAEGPRHCDMSGAINRWITRGTASRTQQAAAAVLSAQEAKGIVSHGQTLDDANLSLMELLTHLQQEQADSLMYTTAAIEKLKEEGTNV